MSYSSILGQDEALQVLKGALTSARPGHAYLFHGPEGVGKSMAALAFAYALNCERGGPEACGECLTCRRAAHGNLRDIEVIEPGSKSGQAIEIDQVRELIARASTRPTEGRRKVFLMPQAHRLSPPAMQTLLKTLEEPPEFVTLILETRDLTTLLPTLISRCQTVRFRPLHLDVLAEILRQHKVPEEKTRVAAAYAQGSAGEALALATDPQVWKRREQTLDLMARLPGMRRVQALRAAEELQALAAKASKSGSAAAGGDAAVEDDDSSDAANSSGGGASGSESGASSARIARTGLAEVLRVVQSWYGDLLALHAGGDPAAIRNPDRTEQLRASLATQSPERLYAAMHFLLKTDHLLQRNANPRLLSEYLMLRLLPLE